MPSSNNLTRLLTRFKKLLRREKVRKPPTVRDGVCQDPRGYIVPGVGRFKHKAYYSFENGILSPDLRIANYPVGKSDDNIPYSHLYQEANVTISNDGFLELKIPGGQNPARKGVIHCAEIETKENRILYASVRTRATFSNVPGACHGLFFYKSDNQETDIEYISDPASLSNPRDGARPHLQFCNQPTSIGGTPAQMCVDAPDDITAVHEYRIDWIKNKTMFYTDGKLQATLSNNVPSTPGQWIWNNWCNGDPGFSCGPPIQDSVLRIKDITMYYNTAN